MIRRITPTPFVCLASVLAFAPSLPAGVIDLRIASSADDAEESSSRSVSLSSSDLELVNDGTDQTVGLRFPGLSIPQGATILSAWVQFETDEVSTAGTSLRFEAQAVDSAPEFTTATGDVSSRARSAAWIPWSPPAWDTVGEAGADQRTPDLTVLIQEIIDRPGWVAGNSLAVIVTGTGRRTARAQDGSSTGAALLHVDFQGEASQPSAVDEVHWTITGSRSVTFDWRGPVAENMVRLGLISGALTTSVTGVTPTPLPDSSAGPFWEARVTGLNPDTLYFYRIGMGPEATFRTPQAAGTSGFWVAAEADIGGPPAIYPNAAIVQQQIAADTLAIPGDDRPRLVLAAGDLSYADQSGPQAVDDHFNTVMVWSRWAAYMPAWGNHEDGSSQDDRQNYEGRFDFPNSQDSPNAPAAGGPGEEWMWFDVGSVRFITYPEPFSGAWHDWAAKADPIMAQAQSEPGISFIVTYGHRPPYSSSSDHGGEPTLAGLQETLAARYSKYRLNISGHAHHYERSDPLRTGGLTQIVAAGGGATQSSLVSTQPTWSAFRLSHLHHVRLHILPDRIEGFAICGPAGSGATGTCIRDGVFDEFTIMAPFPPPRMGTTGGAAVPPDEDTKTRSVSRTP